MSTKTANLELIKLALSDFYNRLIDNDNLDKIDASVGAKVSTSAIVNDLTTGGETVPASAETVKTLKTQIGSQTFTENNYATDAASDTANIDALDMAVKDNADLISSNALKGTIVSDTTYNAAWITGTWTADSATDVLSCSADHGLAVNDPVSFGAGTGALPTGLSAEPEFYYVVSTPTSKTLTVSLTKSGSTVDITADGTAGWTVRRARLTGVSVPIDFSE